MTGKETLQIEELDQAEKLCEVCGSVMITEDDKLICPHCDAEIDFFGEEDADDTK